LAGIERPAKEAKHQNQKAETMNTLCQCQHCHQNVEFDVNEFQKTSETPHRSMGQTVTCQHCQGETVLYIMKGWGEWMKDSTKKKMLTIALLTCLAFSTWAQTNYFSTIEIAGKTFTNCTIRVLNPAQAIVRFDGGGATVSLADLPEDMREQFNYNPTNAAAYLAQRARLNAQMRAKEGQVAANIPLQHYRDLDVILKNLTDQKAKNKADYTEFTKNVNLRIAAGQNRRSAGKDFDQATKGFNKKQADLDLQISAIRSQQAQFQRQYNLPPPGK
jgi:hypothetical protein